MGWLFDSSYGMELSYLEEMGCSAGCEYIVHYFDGILYSVVKTTVFGTWRAYLRLLATGQDNI